MKQIFIVQINEVTDGEYYNFFRLGCKRKETALKHLKGWIEQANSSELDRWLYRCFFKEGATYKIISTPDGSTEGDVVASGFCSEFIK